MINQTTKEIEMNQQTKPTRIHQLAEQTGGEFYEGFAGSTNFVKFTEDDFEKFAELLVKECAGKCNTCEEALAQPEREWVGLTDEEIYLCTNHIDRNSRGWANEYARAIEAVLRSKNT